MKYALDQLRCLIAELFLSAALSIVPADSRECSAMADALGRYADAAKEWVRDE